LIVVCESLARRAATTLPAVLIAVGAVTLAQAAPASASILAYQYIEARCEQATTPECPLAPDVSYTVPEGESVTAQFTANANHCSDINVRLFTDNPDTGWAPVGDWLRVGPGQTVSSPIDVGAGQHGIQVHAEGIQGGGSCNTAQTGALGGTVRIDSQPVAAPDAPSAAPADGAAPGG
jgi:hypothetical protein